MGVTALLVDNASLLRFTSNDESRLRNDCRSDDNSP
jgi:hypothetical protein